MNRRISRKLASLLLAVSTMVATVIPTMASSVADKDGDGKVGILTLYHMENLDEDGCGDYLLEAKLEEGWQPYTRLQLGVVHDTLCAATHAGYVVGDRKNTHVLEGVKGGYLRDTNNGGSIYVGMITNPVNGIIEVPIHVCAEHNRQNLVQNAYISFYSSNQCYINGSVEFKNAIPISKRTTAPTQSNKPKKREVRFTIRNQSYLVTDENGKETVKQMQLGDSPYSDNGRTMVPVLYAGEALNASVVWDTSTREVVVKKGTTEVRLPINSRYAYYNDGTKVDMGAKTSQKLGRTYIPVGALGSILGASVSWDNATQTAIFYK